MKNTLSFLLTLCTVAVGPRVNAGSAAWNLNPTNNLWNTPENWTPATVPDSETDVATFGASSMTNITVGLSTDFNAAENKVSEILFTSNASAYVLTSTASTETAYSDLLEFFGDGIVNDSSHVQNIVVEAAPGPEQRQPAVIWFMNSASAGDNVVITNRGSASSIGVGAYGGATKFGFNFTDSPSAGNATFINEGGKVSGTIEGGITDVLDYSTAEAATFINQPGEVAGAAAGSTWINIWVDTTGNIGTATFINNAATVTGAEGGWTELDNAVCAGNSFIAYGATSAGPQGGQIYTYSGTGYASFTATGGQGSGAQGGLIEIHNIPDSSQTVVTAEGGNSGGLGGMITLNDVPVSLDQVQFQLLGNGTMDLSALHQPSAIIGSLSGEGTVSLSRSLDIGSNNLNTTFSGVLQDRGGVIKSGSGTLILSGANTYRGGTMITAGALIVSNASGSGTGTGSVAVNGGALGGGGKIRGAVTVGTGSGAGAIIAPSAGTNVPATLTIQSPLTFKTDATYTCKVNTRTVTADQLIAKGVTIENGAQFSFVPVANRRLTAGTVLTVINNSSGFPIAGVFANLPDNSTFTAGRNSYQVSYEGGDGNDLSVTVVP